MVATAKRRMTLKLFLKELEKTKGWVLKRDRYRDRGREWIISMSDCPIIKVCTKLCNRRYNCGEWNLAANELGLSPEIARRIVVAADDHKQNKLRRKLLRATGLLRKENK